MTTVTVTPKGKKEMITVDGKVFLKATPANKWNYIIRLTGKTNQGNRFDYTGKSATLEGASKWQPFAMNDQFVDSAEIRAQYPTGQRIKNRTRGGFRQNGQIWEVPFTDIQKEIIKIERGTGQGA